MTPLPRPTIKSIELYDITVGTVACQKIKDRLSSARELINEAYADYINKAEAFNLHELTSCFRGKYNQIIMCTLTKGELNKLYTAEMVGKNKPARKTYDKIMASAPHLKCPICGIGDVESLDHFAAKAYYPTFAVLALNLSPACLSCNKGKSAPRMSQGNLSLHPYFEPSEIYNEAWLQGKVVQTLPPSVEFYSAPPSHWSQDLSTRTHNHFVGFNLAKRYGVQAASEMTVIISYLSELDTVVSKRQHLERMARIESNTRQNSWRAALYRALSKDQWFIDTF